MLSNLDVCYIKMQVLFLAHGSFFEVLGHIWSLLCFVLATSTRSEEQNQDRVRALPDEPKGSLYFVRSAAYLLRAHKQI